MGKVFFDPGIDSVQGILIGLFGFMEHRLKKRCFFVFIAALFEVYR